MTLLALTLAALALQLYDAWSTYNILHAGGTERNPVARRGMELLGLRGYLGVKIAAVTALTYFAGLQSIWLAVFIVAWYAGFMVFNSRSVK